MDTDKHGFTHKMSELPLSLPAAPESLSHGEVRLRFDRMVPGEASRGFVPYYHFRILLANGDDAGHINFRVGDTEHVRLYAGHVGFEIKGPFRGRGLAGQACRALAPFIQRFYQAVTVTCDPDNAASRRTIEKLGARLIDEVPVPPSEPQYQRGSRAKLRFEWTP
jgi:predicted acetyltransferase